MSSRAPLSFVLLSLTVSVLTILPDYWAYIHTPPGYSFIGINIASNIDDIFGNYFASMIQSRQGVWLYTNPFDFLSKPILHYSLYFLLGKIALLFHLSVPFVYLLACFVFAFIFSLFLLNFLTMFIKERRQRYLAFILCNFGAVYPLAAPESNAFFSLKFPHYTISLLMLFCSLFFLIRYVERGNKKYLVGLGLAVLVLALIHPWMCISLVIAYLLWRTIFLHESIFSGQVIFPVGVVSAIVVPISFYYKVHMPWIDYQYSQSPLLILGLFGPLLLLTLIGLWKVFKEKRGNPLFFLSIWFVVELLFCYLPFPFARRFYEGLFLPFSVLGVVGLTELVQKKIRDVWIGYLFIPVFLCVGAISTYLAHFVWVSQAQLYRTNEEFMVAHTLGELSSLNTRVLALSNSSVFLAGQVNASFYTGHEIQTPDFKKKNAAASRYYLGKMDIPEREKFVQSEHICYVYFGDAEKRVSTIDLDQERYLKLLTKNGKFALYKSLYCNNVGYKNVQ